MRFRGFISKRGCHSRWAKWALFAGFYALCASSSALADISVVWNASEPSHPLKQWSADEIIGLRRSVIHEKESESGRVLAWQGPFLSEFIKTSMKDLPLGQQASVDLLILKNRSGASVAIPRWLITRYPVLLGKTKDSPSFQVVLPWTSRPSIRKESLPLRAYTISDIVSIELSSYDQVYHSFYLKKRNDPVAMKGEKLFVQNCTSCHSAGALQTFSMADLAMSPRTRQLASQGHPGVPDAPKITESEARALVTYLDAFRAENSAAALSDHKP